MDSPPPTGPNGRAPAGLTLLVDADDTLWENNIYFEAVVQRYCALLARRGCAPAVARETLLGIERVRTKSHGYGIANFGQSLRAACGQLLGSGGDEEIRELDVLCEAIRGREMELLPGVAHTLAHLASRHRLILFTKGDAADQHDKIERSGLARWFAAVDVVKEKDASEFGRALRRHDADPASAWMIGNSPRSDIAPALANGMGAVFIPHPATWVLELDPLPEGPHERLLELRSFEELRAHF